MSDDEGVAPMLMDDEDDHEQLVEEEAEAEAEEEHDEAAEGEGEEGGAEEKEHNSDEPATASSSSSTPLKRPMTAYFLFLAAERPAIIAALDAEAAEAQAAAGEGAEAVKSRSKNVAVIGKMLGDKWKTMTDEEKQPYLTRHQELKDAYDAAILADPSLAPAKRGGKASASSGSQHEQGALSHDILLPLARIKKIWDMDPSNADAAAAAASASTTSAASPAKSAAPRGRISKEGLLALEKATEHFIAWVATRAHQAAFTAKRRGLKGCDVEAAVKSLTPLTFLRAPLKRSFELMAAAEAAQGEERREKFEEIKRKKAKAKEDAAAEQKEGAADEGAGTAAVGDADDAAAASAPSPVKPKPKPVRTIDSMFSKAAK